MTKECLHKQLL